MRPVAVVGAASIVGGSAGRNDAELLAPVVARALAASGLRRDELGVVCTASSEFLNGVVGTMMGAFDAFPGWPPRAHSHLEGEGGFALHEAWIRLQAGESDAALVCAYSRPSAHDPLRPLSLQLDPYLVGPLGADGRHLAALQARALLDTGRYDERSFAEVAAARRGDIDIEDLLARPYVASPLRAADCSDTCCGAVAVVLATGALVRRAERPPAWITAIGQSIDPHALGGRDLTDSPSTRQVAQQLGLGGAALDVLEVHAPFSHQELILLDAIGARSVGAVNPSGGALPADPTMATGLMRIAAAASAITDGMAAVAVGHATNGPCLQHNLLCRLERR